MDAEGDLCQHTTTWVHLSTFDVMMLFFQVNFLRTSTVRHFDPSEKNLKN